MESPSKATPSEGFLGIIASFVFGGRIKRESTTKIDVNVPRARPHRRRARPTHPVRLLRAVALQRLHKGRGLRVKG